MPDADTVRSQLIYRKETTFGEALPTNPPMTALPITAETFKVNNTTLVSDIIRSDGNRAKQYLVGQGINGGFNFEMMDAAFDPFLESLMRGVFTSTVLKNGTTAQTYFQLERGLLDVPMFLTFRDCTPNTLNITAPSRGKVTGDFGFMGTIGAVATTTMRGTGTLTAAPLNPVFTSGPGINNILINAAPIGVGVTSIGLSINQNLRERTVVDSLTSRAFGRGDVTITGKLDMFFSSNALYQIFLANTSFALAFTLSDNVSKAYDFLLPNCQPSDDQLPISGINADVVENFAFQAYYDNTLGAEMSITKRSF